MLSPSLLSVSPSASLPALSTDLSADAFGASVFCIYDVSSFSGLKTGITTNHITNTIITITNAIGIISKSGNNGGTFAHSDIALEFASWLSPEFKLYLIKEFERLKRNEAYQEKIDWNASRILSKANYKIHTDAIKKSIVPNLVTDNQKKHAYSTEADLLNVALFGMTAKEWKDKNSGLKGNQRDYADIRQLLVLCNLETINATMINDKIAQPTRLEKLNKIAIEQLKILENDENLTKLKTTEFIKIENK